MQYQTWHRKFWNWVFCPLWASVYWQECIKYTYVVFDWTRCLVSTTKNLLSFLWSSGIHKILEISSFSSGLFSPCFDTVKPASWISFTGTQNFICILQNILTSWGIYLQKPRWLMLLKKLKSLQWNCDFIFCILVNSFFQDGEYIWKP